MQNMWMTVVRWALVGAVAWSAGCGTDTREQQGSGLGASGSSASGGVCAGGPGALQGQSTQTLMAGGLARSFVYYAPPGLDPATPAPVVIVPHGYTMNAEQMVEITRYTDLADRERFIVMFPNGQPNAVGPWNVGAPDCGSSLGGLLPTAAGDDQAFVDAMLAFAEADRCIDRAHVFVAGFSMGGYFSNETGCMRPDIRAVAPHSGGTHDLTSCASTHKPVLIMHFQEDALIPYKCGTQARDRWVAHNGCQMDAPEIRAVVGGSCEYYKGCPADGQVALCSFTLPAGEPRMLFAGHGWSGGSKAGTAGGADFAVAATESASELSWAFFKEFAWQ